MITVKEIDKIRLALDTPEHNIKYIEHTTDAKKILNKLEKAINYSQCCKSDSELLPQKSKDCISISPEPCKHKGVCELCS